MARKVFVHVGTMKSATTYLQELAHGNAQRLAEQGVLWPSPDLPFLALAELLGRDQERPGHAGAWAELVRSIADHPGTGVFSNELLAPIGRASVRRIVAAFQPAEVGIVITARDLSRVIPSHWQTTLKNGSTTPWAQFAAAVCAEPAQRAAVARNLDIGSWFWRRHDVPAIIDRWSRQVPPQQITVVTVPPAGSDPRLVGERFARTIGVSTDGFKQPQHDNSSVGAYSAELLRRLNATDHGFQRHHFRWGVKESLVRRGLAVRADSEPRFGLAADQLAWVRERADRMIDEIASSGVTVVGDLNDLRPPPAGRSEAVDPASASDDDLLHAALAGLAGLVHVAAEQQLERERSLRENAAQPPR
jgi:hypothetical protein